MQRGQHQVPGQGSLDSDLRRLEVADFTNHDDVGVLPQDRTQGLGKGQVNFRVDLGLANTGQLVFNRVFHRHDVVAVGIQPLQARIEGGGFAGTSGASHQHNAVWLGHQLLKFS